MKSILLILFTFISILGISQNCPNLGPDQYLPCGVTSTTLTADFSQCPPGINPKSTTTYSQPIQIPYVTQTTGINNTNNWTDDSQQGPFNIGFNFCFFGTTYTQFYIGSNGWISFSAGQPTTFTSAAIPSNVGTVPRNCIMGPWQDWHPGLGGQIKYQVQGTAPCRKLVVSWVNVPMYSCTNLQGTFHIVIYETTNIIETYIQSKPNCVGWANGTAVHGIHNQAGTVAFTVPGRNSQQWTATNDAWQWNPNGPTVNPTPTWYLVGNATPIGTGNSITVTPPANGANYTCHLIYPICNSGWVTCQGGASSNPDTVFVDPGDPNLLQPNITTSNPICADSCNGSISLNMLNGTPPYTINWSNGQNGITIDSLCNGVYSAQIVDDNGCTVATPNIQIIDPALPISTPISSNDTVCFGSTSDLYSVVNTPNLNWVWSSQGNILSGQGSNIIGVDWSNIASGDVNNAVSVYPVDNNGCHGDTSTFDIVILEILPVISPVGNLCSNDTCIQLNATPIGGVFSGNGVFNDYFCPFNNMGSNIINYSYTLSGCQFDTISTIFVNQQPTILSTLPSDNQLIELCENDSIFMVYSATSDIISNNIWLFDNDSIFVNNFGTFWSWLDVGSWEISVVSESNGCISDPVSISVRIIDCPETIYYIPNSFTPNGDEYNNVFDLTFIDGFSPYDFHITIYNRWGQTIFESYDVDKSWDGTYNGKVVQDGIYTWVITFKSDINATVNMITGHVNVMR